MSLERALAGLRDYNEAGAELAGISDQLETLQNQELPALEQRRQLITEGAAALAKLDAAIELGSKGLEPLRLRHDGASKQLADGDQLAGQLQATHQRLADLRQSQEGAEAREQALAHAAETKREARLRLNAQKQQLDQRNQLLQLLVERARLSESHGRLHKEIEQLRASAAQRSALEQQLAAGPVIGRAELSRLRKLQQAWRDAATRQQAMAAGVRVLRADQLIRINGEALASGEQQQLSSVFELQVGEGVALEITQAVGKPWATWMRKPRLQKLLFSRPLPAWVPAPWRTRSRSPSNAVGWSNNCLLLGELPSRMWRCRSKRCNAFSSAWTISPSSYPLSDQFNRSSSRSSPCHRPCQTLRPRSKA